MRRREFILTLVGSAAALPAVARAETSPIRIIGALMSSVGPDDPEGLRRAAAFRHELQQRGLIDGKNVRIEFRWGAGNQERIEATAKELAALAPDVVLAWGTFATKALRRVAPEIPLVFVAVTDPIGNGFVTNLAHPDGPVTGFANVEPDLAGKWVEIIKEAAPQTGGLAVLFHPGLGNHRGQLDSIAASAASYSLAVTSVPIRDTEELDAGVAMASHKPNTVLVVLNDPFTVAHRGEILALAKRYRMIGMYPYRYFTTAGGLMSYGIDLLAQLPGAVDYIDRILKGEKPGSLPVQEAAKFEFVINLKTAKALGLTIPPSLLATADEVIE